MQTLTRAQDLPIGPDVSRGGPGNASVSISEQIHQAKKLQGLEEELAQLTNASGIQTQVVSKLEESLRSCISQSELQRAIGLAFQEFETRLGDAFQDSNRKFLNLFAKKEDVAEVHSAVNKKVNWGEYHQVLGKLAELRAYIDTAAESVFVGHRDALHQEFARKADAATVDMALKSKADFGEVNDLRARLERLEMLLSHAGTHQSARLEELRDEMNSKLSSSAKQLSGQLKEHTELIQSSQEHQAKTDEQLAGCARCLDDLTRSSEKLFETTRAHGRTHAETGTQITQIKELIEGVNAIARKNRKVLDDAVAELHRDNRDSKQRFGEISSKEKVVDRQLEYLVQASEASKRKVKELGKSLGKACTGLATDNERCAEAVAGCEQKLRQTEQKLRALEGEGGLSALAGRGGKGREKSPSPSPTRHLAGVLEQLQAIVSEEAFQPPLPSKTNRLMLPAPAAPPWTAGGSSGAKIQQADLGGGVPHRPPVPPLPSSAPGSARGGQGGGNSARGRHLR